MYDTSGLTFAVGCYRGSAPAKGQVFIARTITVHHEIILVQPQLQFIWNASP